jgi:hypothetical protein
MAVSAVSGSPSKVVKAGLVEKAVLLLIGYTAWKLYLAQGRRATASQPKSSCDLCLAAKTHRTVTWTLSACPGSLMLTSASVNRATTFNPRILADFRRQLTQIDGRCSPATAHTPRHQSQSNESPSILATGALSDSNVGPTRTVTEIAPYLPRHIQPRN